MAILRTLLDLGNRFYGTDAKTSKKGSIVNSRREFLTGGTSWLLEMEYVANPVILNALVLNLVEGIPTIAQHELLSDVESSPKKMLVFLRLHWWARWFFKQRTAEHVVNMLTQGLPTFQFRVIYDHELFTKAVVRAKVLAQHRHKLFPRL